MPFKIVRSKELLGRLRKEFLKFVRSSDVFKYSTRNKEKGEASGHPTDYNLLMTQHLKLD